MLIDSTYFVNKINLAQVGNSLGLADVNNFIAQYEEQYLRCVLGPELYAAFIDEVSGSGVTDDPRYVDLLRGADFMHNSRAYHWTGFVPLPPAIKVSPIANYVFYQYVENKITDFTLIGEVQSDTDNNRTVSPVDRLVDTWNRMVDMNLTLRNFLQANKTIYPEYKPIAIHDRYYDPFALDNCGCYDRSPCAELFKKKNSLGL